jgi:WD40 repeat protein
MYVGQYSNYMPETPEKCDPTLPECGFLGDCPEGMECPLSRKEPEKEPEIEILALYRTYYGHRDAVLSLAVSPDSKTALSGSADLTMRLWDLVNGTILKTFEGHTNEVDAVCFVNSAVAMSGGWDNTLRLWGIKLGVQKHVIKGFDFYIRSIAASKDGHYALVGSGDKTLKYIDLDTGDTINTMMEYKNVISSVAFAGPDMGIAGSWDRSISMWDLKAGKYMRSFDGHEGYVYSIVVSQDGKYLLSGSGDKTLKYWDIGTGECIRTMTGHSGHVKTVALTPDGRYALSGGSDKLLKMWDLGSGKCLQTLESHDDIINSVAVSPDGRFALSGSRDKTIKRWEFI